MKKVVYGLLAIIFIFVIIMIAYTFHGRSVRQTELDNALISSMKKAVEMLQEEPSFAPEDNEEFVALFLEAFLLQIDSSSSATVHILDVDYEKGLLSVEAILTYKHPIGTEGRVKSQKTIILEQYSIEEDVEYVTIQFMAEGKILKVYNLHKGSSCIEPEAPIVDGKLFVGWEDESGTIVNISGLTANEDTTYFAVFK